MCVDVENLWSDINNQKPYKLFSTHCKEIQAKQFINMYRRYMIPNGLKYFEEYRYTFHNNSIAIGMTSLFTFSVSLALSKRRPIKVNPSISG